MTQRKRERKKQQYVIERKRNENRLLEKAADVLLGISDDQNSDITSDSLEMCVSSSVFSPWIMEFYFLF